MNSTQNRTSNVFISTKFPTIKTRAVSAFLTVIGIAIAWSAPVITPAMDAPEYTGIVVDVRHLPEIDRSPAPVIYGPAPEQARVYPDPKHVPTPDEVQEQSVVRYYHTEDQAEKGAGGEHPYIIKAEAVVGPAHDSVRISAEDAEKLKNLDETMHFTRTWKVAFLIPENR